MQPIPLFAIILAAARGPHQEQMLQPTHLFALILAIALVAIVVVLWIVLSTIRKVKVARMQSEVHAKLVDKVTSSQDFSSFLNSEAGKGLAASLFYEQHRGHGSALGGHQDPYGRILISLRRGIILLALGVVFLIFAMHFARQSDGFLFFGGLGVALGAGFLISSWVSYGLSKKLGLLNQDRNTEKPLP